MCRECLPGKREGDGVLDAALRNVLHFILNGENAEIALYVRIIMETQNQLGGLRHYYVVLSRCSQKPQVWACYFYVRRWVPNTAPTSAGDLLG